jgi:hypothetical protein
MLPLSLVLTVQLLLAIEAINIFWLTPVASLVALEKLEGIVGFIVAYISFIFISIRQVIGKFKLRRPSNEVIE